PPTRVRLAAGSPAAAAQADSSSDRALSRPRPLAAKRAPSTSARGVGPRRSGPLMRPARDGQVWELDARPDSSGHSGPRGRTPDRDAGWGPPGPAPSALSPHILFYTRTARKAIRIQEVAGSFAGPWSRPRTPHPGPLPGGARGTL